MAIYLKDATCLDPGGVVTTVDEDEIFAFSKVQAERLWRAMQAWEGGASYSRRPTPKSTMRSWNGPRSASPTRASSCPPSSRCETRRRSRSRFGTDSRASACGSCTR